MKVNESKFNDLKDKIVGAKPEEVVKVEKPKKTKTSNSKVRCMCFPLDKAGIDAGTVSLDDEVNKILAKWDEIPMVGRELINGYEGIIIYYNI